MQQAQEAIFFEGQSPAACTYKERNMDVVYLAMGLAFWLLLVAMARGCAGLEGKQ